MPIIVGTDLSAASTGALDVALALAELRGETYVTLVHVGDPAGSPAARDEALENARIHLEELAQKYAASKVTVRTELLLGEPDQTLLQFAETEDSNLIVIAARSKGGPIMRLGSTSSKLVARATVPVLLVRDPAPLLAYARRERNLRVLLGIDDSAVCDLGIQWTHAMRRLAPMEIVLGRVYYPDDEAERYGFEGRTIVDSDPEIEALLERDLLHRFGGDGKNVVARARRGLGRLGDHVVELAREENVDLIVVGTGQKSGLNRLGSVSAVIVDDAPQSVVCVPPHASLKTITVPQIQSTLVATDLSQFANRAVAYAFAITPPTGVVHIVHVVKDDAEVNEAELTRSLDALTPENATQTVHCHVVRGDEPAVTLAQCAARHGVDVICISSHGRSGIARALVGSVADQLLRATRLPVLVLRPA